MLEAITTALKNLGIIAGSVYGIFELVERLAGESLRNNAIYWIQKRSATNPAAQFSSAIDAIFGPRHLSWRCLFVSTGFSLILFVAILSVMHETDGAFRFIFVHEEGFFLPAYGPNLILLFGCIIPDYLSLGKSRAIIKLMVNKSRYWPYILIDLLLAFIGFNVYVVIGETGVMSLIFFNSDIRPSLSLVLEQLTNAYSDLFRLVTLDSTQLKDDSKLILTWILSTFSTSIWVWLYVFSVRALRGVDPLSWMARGMILLKFKEQPFRVIGVFAATYCTIALAFIVGIRNLVM